MKYVRAFAVFAVTLIVAFSTLSQSVAPRAVAQTPTAPPFSYQSEILMKNPVVCARWGSQETLLRRGYYVGNTGFGYDKMYNYHQIRKFGVWVATVGVLAGCAPDADPTTAVFRNYFERVQCSFWIINCRATGEIQWVRSVESNRLDQNMTTSDKRKGNISIYCENPATAPLCPDWMAKVPV
ncbi:hypothetical protein [Rhodococcus sp. 14-2470-1a]|uniref:hypothetical protein n=1 Tax=Rhodococcus sp. 14-2470-1a TaxID=2023150 RepID=UPI000B9AD2FE|nr:hypothetical protein [Rhodococcus sp. 14-2470-1a]OZF42079.1 hypothetical protein CH292_26665 [Rhodococcus sp. 14-2470-1a]